MITNFQENILRYIARHPSAAKVSSRFRFTDGADESFLDLQEALPKPISEWVVISFDDNSIILTDHAISVLEQKRRERVRVWVPIAISIFALVIAVAALIVSVIALPQTQQLLQSGK